MNGLNGTQLQLEMGERVLLIGAIGAIVDAAMPGLVSKAGVGQRTQREQGAHEKRCQPEAKAHLETFPTSLLQRSQLISPEVQGMICRATFRSHASRLFGAPENLIHVNRSVITEVGALRPARSPSGPDLVSSCACHHRPARSSPPKERGPPPPTST